MKLLQPLIEIISSIKYPNFEVIKFNQGNVTIKCLRKETVRWLCILGHVNCLEKAHYELQWYLTNRDLIHNRSITNK